MKKMYNLLFFTLAVMLFISGCNSKSTNTSDDIFRYKDSFVGDNSAVGNIVNQLPGANDLNGFELKTNKEPYGIILNYSELLSDKAYQETVVYNATFLFALIQNVDWVTFNSVERQFTITKADLQAWYAIQLSEIETEDELKELINEYLEDESKVDQLIIQN